MKTYNHYIYAGAKLKAKEGELLTEAQVTKLESAPSFSLAWQALQDTFVGPYLDQANITEPSLNDLKKSLDNVMIDTKKDLMTSTPDKQVLDILWTKYDFHNLRVIIRGRTLKMSDEKMEDLALDLGIYDFKKLRKAYDDKRLALLDKYLEKSALATENFTNPSEIGVAVNIHYFEKIKDLAKQSPYPFTREYVALLIDLFNAQTALRIKTIRPEGATNVFITGGNLKPEELENKESILKGLTKLSGEALWQEAIDYYKETGHHTLIRKTAEECVNQFLKKESWLTFTPASLFLYFNAKKRDVQAVQIIIAGKEAGLSEDDIRLNLRELSNK